MKRTTLVWIAAALALLLAAYSGYWWIVAGRLGDGIDAWVKAEQQAGVTIDAPRSAIGGYPFFFRTTFQHPHVAGRLGGQAFDWQGADIEASAAPFSLTTPHFFGTGTYKIDLGAGTIVMDAVRLRVRLALDGGILSQISVMVDNAKLTAPDGSSLSLQSGAASFSLPPSAPRSDQDPLLAFTLAADRATLPATIQLLTNDPLSGIALAGTVKGPMPMGPLQQALSAWRDRGGSVDITSFAATQGPLSVTGSATVALDQNLQPIIAANLKAKGLAPAIDLLASQNRIAPADAFKAKLFVTGAEQDAPGGGKEVATGLTIQGGYLFWGPVKLARVPPIEWP